MNKNLGYALIAGLLVALVVGIVVAIKMNKDKEVAPINGPPDVVKPDELEKLKRSFDASLEKIMDKLSEANQKKLTGLSETDKAAWKAMQVDYQAKQQAAMQEKLEEYKTLHTQLLEAQKAEDKAKADELAKKLADLHQQIEDQNKQFADYLANLPAEGPPTEGPPGTGDDSGSDQDPGGGGDEDLKKGVGIFLAGLAVAFPEFAVPLAALGKILGIGGSTQTIEAVSDIARNAILGGEISPAVWEKLAAGLIADGGNPQVLIQLSELANRLEATNPALAKKMKEEIQKVSKKVIDSIGISEVARNIQKQLQDGKSFEEAVKALPTDSATPPAPYYPSQKLKDEVLLICTLEGKLTTHWVGKFEKIPVQTVN